MGYSIILDYRTGTKKPIKELRIRVRNTSAQIDVRKVTGIKVLENHIRTIDKQVYELDKTQHLDVSWREIIDKETYQRRKRSFDSSKDVIRETL